MTNFSKSDLIRAVAESTGLKKADADAAVQAVLSTIRQRADAGNAVALQGFGRFTMKERAAREGRNPRTGEPVQIAASRTLTFKAAKSTT